MCWIVPVTMVTYRLNTTEDTIDDLHEGDYDMVPFIFVGLQIFIRAIIISMKYGTVTEQWMRRARTEVFDFKELARGLTVFGWL